MVDSAGLSSSGASLISCENKSDVQNLERENEDKLKTCVHDKIEKFSEDVDISLLESGILNYLIKIGIEYIANLYETKQGEAESLIKSIWINDYPDVMHLFEDEKFNNENIIYSIKSRLCVGEKMNLFEPLLIFTDAVGIMKRQFKSNNAILQQLRIELEDLHNRGIYLKTNVNLPLETMTSASFSRGDLMIDVDFSRPCITAGDEFSLFVKITNPFEVPIIIYSVETQMPVELVSVERWRREDRSQSKGVESDGIDRTKSKSIARGFTTFDIINMREGREPEPYVLQPNDSITKEFVFITRGRHRWITFIPTTLAMKIQLRYGLDNRCHLKTIKAEVNIQVRLEAIAIGALLGGLAGSMIRQLGDNGRVLLIYNATFDAINSTPSDKVEIFNGMMIIFISVIFSIAAVIAFARKAAAQKIISIEDFYGGFLIGFLVGLQGPEFAKQLIMGNSTQLQ